MEYGGAPHSGSSMMGTAPLAVALRAGAAAKLEAPRKAQTAQTTQTTKLRGIIGPV